MKQFYLLLFLCACNLNFSVAQNLVLNPSFELYNSCPDDYSQFDRVQNWILINEFETPDYFNACDTNNNFSIPNNIFGSQIASTGSAYSGLFFYGFDETLGIDYREYIACSFNNSLSIGIRYYVTFKVSPTTSNQNSHKFAIDKICALFTTNLYVPTFPLTFLNYAQIYPDYVIDNTSEWTTVSGSFVADSSYNFLTIGNFFSDSLTNTSYIGGAYSLSYYYVDDVCVSTDSLSCALFTGTNEIEKIKFEIYPNPAKEKITLELAVGSWQLATVAFHDLMGREVLLIPIQSSKNTIDISSLSSGVYTAVLSERGIPISRKKIVVE